MLLSKDGSFSTMLRTYLTLLACTLELGFREREDLDFCFSMFSELLLISSYLLEEVMSEFCSFSPCSDTWLSDSSLSEECSEVAGLSIFSSMKLLWSTELLLDWLMEILSILGS